MANVVFVPVRPTISSAGTRRQLCTGASKQSLIPQDYGWVDEARTQHHDAALRPRQSQRLSIKDPQPAEQAAQQAPTVDDAEQPGAQSATSVDQAAQPQAQSAAPRTTAEQTDFWKLLGAQNKDDLEGILSVCEGAHLSPVQAAMALRKAARAAQRLSSPLRIMQARDRRVSSLVEALSLHSNDVRDDDPSACEAPSLDARSSAAAVWSLAVFGGPLLFEADMDVLLEVITFDTLTADELSDVAWALGAAHHYTGRLPHLEAGLQRLGPSMLRPLHVTTVLWAFARLDYLPTGLLAAVGSSWQLAGPQRGKNGKRAAQAALPRMTARQLATCAWALAALQQTGTPTFEALWVEICSRGLDGLGLGTTLRNDSLMQLHQAHLALQLEGGENTQQLVAATTSPSGAALLAKVRTTWEALSRPVHGQRESSQQRELANTLSSLGYFHVVEDTSSGYAVDLAVPQQRLAIEADGPSHFTRNTGDIRPLGHTNMKHRHLRLLGWQVVSVPWFEWDDVRGPVMRREYLLSHIEPLLQSAR